MGERSFDNPNLTADLWSMGIDVDLNFDGQSKRSSNGFLPPVSGTNLISENVNINYTDMQTVLLHRFDDVLSDSMHRENETPQSLLSKISCDFDGDSECFQKELNSTTPFNSNCDMSDDFSHRVSFSSPLDVFGKVSILGGKLILQLKYFNNQFSDSFGVKECWLCKEKILEASNVPIHKHVLQGLFHANSEFVQFDIDHYIIPEHALENTLDIKRNYSSINSNSETQIPDHNYRSQGSMIYNCPEDNRISRNANEKDKTSFPNFSTSDPAKDVSMNSLAVSNPNNDIESFDSSNVSIDTNSFLNTLLRNDIRKSSISTDMCMARSPICKNIVSNMSTDCQETINNAHEISERLVSSDNNFLQTDVSENHMYSTQAYQNSDLNQHMNYSNSHIFENQNSANNSNAYFKCNADENVLNKPKIDNRESLKSEVSKDLNITSVKKDHVPNRDKKSKLQNSSRRSRDEISSNLHVISNLDTLQGKKNYKSVHDSSSDPEFKDAYKTAVSQSGDSKSLLSPSLSNVKIKSQNEFLPENRGHFNIACPLCKCVFSRRKLNLFLDHIKVHNLSKIKFKCPDCNLLIMNPDLFIEHLRVRRCQRFYCSKCNASYNRKGKLRRHISAVHNLKKPYICDICSKSFCRPEYLKVHRNIHENKKVECDVCHKLFSSQFNMITHKKLHTNKTLPFSCNICSKSFVRKDFLSSHIESVHQKKRYSCDICSKTFSRIDILNRHKKEHMNKVDFTCLDCGKGFLRKYTLKLHVCKGKFKEKIDKKEKGNKQSVSEELSGEIEKKSIKSKIDTQIGDLKDRNNKNALDMDIAMSSKNLSGNKEEIDTGFSLNTPHGSTVSKENPVNLKSFDGKSSYKKFQCELCSKSYTRRYSLKLHQRIHDKKIGEDEKLLSELPKVLRSSKAKLKKLQTSDELIDSSYGAVSDHLSSVDQDFLSRNAEIQAAVGSVSMLDNANSDYKKSTKFTSPISLSADAITAAAYLLTNPFYEGSY